MVRFFPSSMPLTATLLRTEQITDDRKRCTAAFRQPLFQDPEKILAGIFLRQLHRDQDWPVFDVLEQPAGHKMDVKLGDPLPAAVGGKRRKRRNQEIMVRIHFIADVIGKNITGPEAVSP